MSIIYLAVASLLGIFMLGPSVSDASKVRPFPSQYAGMGVDDDLRSGLPYLPRFAGKPLKSPKMGELQFWLANIGLIGMLFFTPSEAFILRRECTGG